MANNFEEIAKQFIEFYYNQFDSDRKGLASLYREQSMLTFESASSLGVNSIVEKLTVCTPKENAQIQCAACSPLTDPFTIVPSLREGQAPGHHPRLPAHHRWRHYHPRHWPASGTYMTCSAAVPPLQLLSNQRKNRLMRSSAP
ncbi:hypothetical protein CaCOL14_012950 [Colletotrichum acutatum]